MKEMFKEIFKKATKSRKHSVEPLASTVVHTILHFAGPQGIPPMPSSAQRAFEVANDPRADARDFLEILEGDEALSARVMKIANSVYFDRGKGSKTLEECIRVIGVNELRSLLCASTLKEIFPSRNPLRSMIWRHDLAVASFSRSLSKTVSDTKPETAYLAGLMHDVGKLLLLQKSPEQYAKVLSLLSSSIDFHRAEGEIFPFDHTEVGALIAERWNFTNDLQIAIRQHHLPWAELQRLKNRYPLIVKVADNMVHASGVGIASSYPQLKSFAKEDAKNAADSLSLGAKEFEDLRCKFLSSFEAEEEALGQP